MKMRYKRILFQYQHGSIKRLLYLFARYWQGMFQYQHGSIKSSNILNLNV